MTNSPTSNPANAALAHPNARKGARYHAAVTEEEAGEFGVAVKAERAVRGQRVSTDLQIIETCLTRRKNHLSVKSLALTGG
jgi:hypothetical protein